MAKESVKIDTEVVDLVRIHVATSKQTIGGYAELAVKEMLNNGIIGRIKSDPELFKGWQANIAMAYIDAETWYRKENNKTVLNQHDKHVVANNAATNFLNLLIK